MTITGVAADRSSRSARRFWLGVVCAAALLVLDSWSAAAGLPARPGSGRTLSDTAEDFLTLPGVTAIAHRGYGDNLGLDPTRPIQNTIPAVRRGFREGASVVEVDVVLTKDGAVVALHDDFLADFTCVNTLSLAELQARLPQVASLEAILNQAKLWNRADDHRVSGIVIIELKATSPLCDPADATDEIIVSTVLRVVRRMGMERQVILDSFSPTLLALAAAEAPGIPRELSIALLQFLPRPIVESVVGSLTLIEKRPPAFGLQWAEIGFEFRLPGYTRPDDVAIDFDAAVARMLGVAIALGLRSVAIELELLSTLESVAPGSAAAFVALLKSAGLRATPYTVNTEAHWNFAASLGANAIYVNDVPLGLSHQTPQ